jgi:sialic acid synthase SpsE
MHGDVMKSFFIENKRIGENSKSYFIADIGASHDGEIERAKKLILLAKESGADAVKFQHFSAKNFVSDSGFRKLENPSHQSEWKKSVYEIYQDASIPLQWTKNLKEYSDSIDITFFSSPYGIKMIEHLDPYISVWKVGSGDINYHKQLHNLGQTGKPILLASGASTLKEVVEAVNICKGYTDKIVLMQCNTNYTGQDSNYDHINLNVLKQYGEMFPDIILGLSDHTNGHETVLGAVALGATVIEKHFTDDRNRTGPDHPFSMDPESWSAMVKSTRILERTLGSPSKKVCDNETETIVLQRRAYTSNKDLKKGDIISCDDFSLMRPCPPGSLDINYDISNLCLRKGIKRGSHLTYEHVNI